MRRHSAGSCALIFLAVGLLGGCSGLTPKLDMAKIERGVAKAAKRQFPRASVSAGKCPAHRSTRKGDHFECTVSIEQQTTRYLVTQTDGHASVHISLMDQFVLSRELEPYIRDQLRGDDRGAQVGCGPQFVYILNQARMLSCSVVFANGTSAGAAVAVSASGQFGGVTLTR